MAIDQEIAQRVDAYRGNPQVLQQRYAANQELLDLLALQRLKSEKDDAMRKVQLEMQQDPQTIKQQKERQLLEMTKQDLTNQTAGIMQNTQKKQKKNMQRVAKRGSVSPQQVQKMQAGLGALAQHQQQQAPQQAPMRMAAGGIVAFQGAGLVRSYDDITQAEINAYREKLKKTNRRSAALLSDDLIRKRLSDSTTHPTPSPQQYSVPAHPRLRKTPAEIKTAEFKEKLINAEGEGPQKDPKYGEEGPIVDGFVEKDYEGWWRGREDPNGPVVPEEAPKGIMELMQQPENQLTHPIIDVSGAGDRGQNILDETGLGSLENPDDAMKRSRDDAAVYLGRDKKRGKMNEYLEELKALDVSQQDPRKMRSEQISAFLRNAGGGSFGQTMAGGSQGMADERSAQEKSSRDRLLSRLNIEKSVMDMDMNIATSAQSSGDNAYAQAMANRRQASQVLSSTSNKDVQLHIEQAKLEYNANKDNIRNKLDAASIQYTDELRRAIEASDSSQRGLELLADLQKQKNTIFINAAKSDKSLLAARVRLTKNPNDSTAITAYDDAYKALQIRVNSYFETSSNKGLSVNEVEDLMIKLSLGERISLDNLATDPTSTGFNADAWGVLHERPSSSSK